jgi:hypothetical protein
MTAVLVEYSRSTNVLELRQLVELFRRKQFLSRKKS